MTELPYRSPSVKIPMTKENRITGKTRQNGLLITMEGIDGCGKSVQSASLTLRLKEAGYDVLAVRDPGGPEISEKIRSILLDRKHELMSHTTELFLYEAARAQLVSGLILPALHNGSIVVSDRFFDSTTAYQAYGRGISKKIVRYVNRYASQSVVPDRTFILDIPWDESIRRRGKMNSLSDRMESDIGFFFQKVIDGYHAIARSEPGRVRVLDGCLPIKKLEQEILQDVLSMIHSGECMINRKRS